MNLATRIRPDEVRFLTRALPRCAPARVGGPASCGIVGIHVAGAGVMRPGSGAEGRRGWVRDMKMKMARRPLIPGCRRLRYGTRYRTSRQAPPAVSEVCRNGIHHQRPETVLDTSPL